MSVLLQLQNYVILGDIHNSSPTGNSNKQNIELGSRSKKGGGVKKFLDCCSFSFSFFLTISQPRCITYVGCGFDLAPYSTRHYPVQVSWADSVLLTLVRFCLSHLKLTGILWQPWKQMNNVSLLCKDSYNYTYFSANH